VIELRGVTVTLSGRRLLDALDWVIPDPGLYVLAGGTGAGKSLLCRVLGGRLRPTRGRVLIDGEPLYRMLGGTALPLFYARADQPCADDERLRDYYHSELSLLSAAPSHLQQALMLAEAFELKPDTRLFQLSHGEALLAQIVLAAAAPCRLCVLDGHLTYLDLAACDKALRMLADGGGAAERFIVLSTARLARTMEQAASVFLLDGTVPIVPRQPSPNAAAGLGGAGPAPPGDNPVLRLYFRRGLDYAPGLTSGQHFAIAGRFEEGLRIRLTGRLDEALSELAAHGLSVHQVEWEEPPG